MTTSFSAEFFRVRYSSGRGRKRKDNLNRSRFRSIQARRGDSQPNNQAERGEGLGRIHIYREVCGSDKGNINQAGCLGYSLDEMAFVVGQGVISLLDRCRGWKVSGPGADKSQIDATGLELKFCFVFSEVR